MILHQPKHGGDAAVFLVASGPVADDRKWSKAREKHGLEASPAYFTIIFCERGSCADSANFLEKRANHGVAGGVDGADGPARLFLTCCGVDVTIRPMTISYHPPDEGAQMARMPCAQWGKTGESPALARNGNLPHLAGSPNTRLHRLA